MSDSKSAPEFFIDERCVVFTVMINEQCQSRCILKQMDINDIYPGHWWLFDLRTKPSFRNQGYATSMVTQAQKYVATRAPGTSIVLHAEAFNDAPMPTELLIEWYAKLGFVPQPDGLYLRWEASPVAKC